MAGRPHDHVHAQVRRLFNVGAVGTMSDAQLLDRFVSRRDEAAEAAFEELVIRHGPMVLRVCRSVLHDDHDAEDAFQAVFLVLANRARFIRRSGSVASWLFGVAERVSKRSKRSAARRQALNQVAASRISESYLPPESDPDGDIVYEEINRLPERLRAPIVLCCLQGLTYAGAARELGLSEMAIRGRLARARERLRQRLTRRGVPVPAGFLVASAAGQSQVTIPITLIQCTIRIALGFTAGNTAAILARGVLNSMLLDQLRVMAVLLCLGVGGSCWAWRAFASVVNEKGQTKPGPAVVKVSASSQPPRTDRYGDPLPPGAVMRLGTARFRQPPSIRHMVYSSNGQLVVTDGGQDRLFVWDAKDGRALRQVDLGIEEIRDLVFAPDATTIAAVGFHVEAKRNVLVNHLTFTDAATSRLIRRGEWDDQDHVEKVAYAPDGKTAATVSENGMLRLWDVAGPTLLRQEKLVGEGMLSPESIAFSTGTARRFLAIEGRGTIDLWDVTDFRRTRSILTDSPEGPHGLEFSPDGTTVAAGGREIRLWRVVDGILIGRFARPKRAHFSRMAFSRDGKILAAIASGGFLVFFDVATGKELDLLSSVRSVDGPLAFSPDGKTLTSTGGEQTLHSWDLATGQDRLATPDAHLGDVTALACPTDGKTIVSASRDRSVRIWDLATELPMRTFPHNSQVDSLTVSADGSLLVTGSTFPELGKVNVWSLRNGERLHTCSAEDARSGSYLLADVTLGHDASDVIAALSDGTVRRWDVSTGKERPIPQPKLEKIPSIGPGGGTDLKRVVLSRDGQSAAFVGEQWVQVVDLASGDRRFKAPKSLVPIHACEFAPDGGSLAMVREARGRKFQVGHYRGSSTPTSTIAWLDSRTGSVRREIAVPESHVRSLAFSPDGQAVAVGTLLTHPARGIIRIFRLQDKNEIRTIASPCPWIEALCYTPDGRRIVAGMSDTSIVIWDARPTDYRR